MNKSISESTRCGYVAIVGRPNVGKSTLLNKILQQKISITSRKPQTTRQRILGINTQNNVQAIYVDTPGLHQQAKRAINRYMNRAAIASIYDVDVVVFMVEAMVWKADDQWILDRLAKHTAPVILVVNKIDTIKNKKELLPFLKELSEKFTFAKVIPIAAEQGTNVDQLEQVIAGYLPQAAFIFPEDQVTDRSQRFLAAEIIREKLLRFLGQEVPYSLTVEIEQFEQKQAILHIAAVIWVEKEGQKAIVIGASGAKLKQIGTQARLDMEKLFESKVFLKLWVKVKENWSDDERALKNLGYE